MFVNMYSWNTANCPPARQNLMIAIIVDEIVNVGFRYDYVVIVREILKFRKTLYCIQ